MLTIIIIIGAVVIYLVAFHYLYDWVHSRVPRKDTEGEDFLRNNISCKEYVGEEHEWKHTFNMEHRGLKVFNIPFVPEENEVFYIENGYDEEANLFIQENMGLIKEMLQSRGLSFVYLPYVSVTKEMAEAMVAYHSAKERVEAIDDDGYKRGIKNDFLLDYMVHPQERNKVTRGFCWYNGSVYLKKFNKEWFVFDYISFDGAEARRHPRELLEEMLPELGTKRIWKREGARYRIQKLPSEGFADDSFEEETKKMLADIKEKLDAVRLRGVSEAIIARYVEPCPKLSRMTIGYDFTITLNDYNDTEIVMEPVVKAVFLLFMRHEEGIRFKDLEDYQTELEIIYRAVKAKRNDIDKKMEADFQPQISESVKSLTNPCSNSINEKCARIKEAFVVHFHDSIASNYYVQGVRASAKRIRIPRNLVRWEGEV